MNDYLEKNHNISNWFYSSYYGSKLENLKGNIRFMKQTAYDFDTEINAFKLVDGTACFSLEFNRQKEIIRELDGKERFETKYKNFKDQKVSSKEYLPDNSIELYEYDEVTDLVNKYININKNGIRKEKELKIEKLKDGSMIHHSEHFSYYYDAYDKITLQKANYSDLEIVYDYSTFGRRGYYTKTSHQNDKINSSERFSQENYILQSIMNRDGVFSSKRMFFYDETNQLIQQLTFWDDDSFENHYYFYNEKGLLIEDKISYPGGKIGTCDFFEYDIHDNVINSRDRSYQYKYDEHGNWIEKIEIASARNEILYKTTREFEYFPKGLHVV
ncbi:hypothetical protein [Flavobacterium sp. LC2016-01]|uniref:hypothetical protein n=1 Tax=Flavobacterium sp. LC2016-01 TaxID=2675876 RepID=UPI0012BA9DED|nr:hypothetical protein [Flavobacterium sp. LC2016-01]MTH17385.1 hypothetical protein [Flavobacterium sp. LC2016-01]